MAQVLVIFLVLTQVHVLVTSSIVGETLHSAGESNIAPSPAIRKLGKHRHRTFAMFQAEAPDLSPSKSPKTIVDHSPSNDEAVSTPSTHKHPEAAALLNETHLTSLHHRSSVDKSVAGGGVILGGLAATFFFAVFCYIRATRSSKTRPQPTSPISTTTTTAG